jgi:uracil-DNA glycosylase
MEKMSWKEFHSEEILKDYFKKLMERIDYLYSDEANFFVNVYPPKDLIYRCFEETPLNLVKVVIIGQDPYHQKDQANGLAFAVNEKTTIPPSLKNIMKESGTDDKTLLKWTKQGVLLLNTTLTVIESKPMSCAKDGWEIYTHNAIKYLIENKKDKDPLIFLLWGKHAQTKKELINEYKCDDKCDNIYIFECSHPSPLSANKTSQPFMGCGHFKLVNDTLKKHEIDEIDW